MAGRLFWIVARVIDDPERTCGHKQSNLVAICEDTTEKPAEYIARDFCADETYLIGPWPPNTLVPDHPIVGWPGSYYPLAETRES